MARTIRNWPLHVQIIPSVCGRDLWALVRRNTIVRTWRAPKWLSWRSARL